MVMQLTGEIIAKSLYTKIPASDWLGEIDAGVNVSPHEAKAAYYQHISRAKVGLFLPDVGMDSPR